MIFKYIGVHEKNPSRFKFDSKLANRLFSTPSKKRSAMKITEEEPLDESDDVDVAQAANELIYEEVEDGSCFDRNFVVLNFAPK